MALMAAAAVASAGLAASGSSGRVVYEASGPSAQAALKGSGLAQGLRSVTPTAGLFGGWGFGSRGSSRRRGPGWTQAHVKRMARKARNVARNRRAHR